MIKFGYTIIYVDDVATTMNFYEKAFGLEKGFLHESHQYGEMVTGETKLAFVHHDTAMSHGFNYKKITKNENSPGVEVGLVTTEVKSAFDRAVSAGAVALSEPKAKPWGQVVAYVKDNNGFLVELCSPMGG